MNDADWVIGTSPVNEKIIGTGVAFFFATTAVEGFATAESSAFVRRFCTGGGAAYT